MKGCHGMISDYQNLDIDFNEEPTKKEDGTYEIKASAITSVGHRSIDGWGKIIGMHVCAMVGAAACCGLLVGVIATCLVKR